MKISELIEKLEITKAHVGDVEVLIELVDNDTYYMSTAKEVSYEDRDGFGPSVAILE